MVLFRVGHNRASSIRGLHSGCRAPGVRIGELFVMYDETVLIESLLVFLSFISFTLEGFPDGKFIIGFP